MKNERKLAFSMCSHPPLVPTIGQENKPEPARTVGTCPVHNYSCPVRGFGVGSYPLCHRKESE